jgi:multiple sugar transport system ATP-binding protein
VRPAHLRPAAPSDSVNIIGAVDLIEFLGNDALISFKYAGVEIGVLLPTRQCPRVGEQVRMTFSDDNLHVFDKETGRSLTRHECAKQLLSCFFGIEAPSACASGRLQ